MPNFLFWNTRGRAIEANLLRLVRAHRVDVLILAENEIPRARMLELFDQEGIDGFLLPPNRSKRL